ncbi:hypothetical protein LguiB_011621 [Lonicera macranthoides]
MASSSWLQSFLNPSKNWFAAQHKKAVAGRLRRYGLRFEDLYDPKEDLDIKEAMNRLPREIVDARNQRLKRAMDLSMKHEYLPEDLQVYMYIYLSIYVCILLFIVNYQFMFYSAKYVFYGKCSIFSGRSYICVFFVIYYFQYIIIHYS